MADKKSFAIKQKKSPFQLHKEAEEAKKKRLDEEAALVYEEFVAAFNGDAAQAAPKAFVRGGVVEPGSRPSSEPTADKKLGSKYVPSFLPPSMSASRGREERPASVFDLPARADKSKPRAIDAVLEEMQREREQRRSSGFDQLPEDAAAQRGSYDTGDPTTTNLYVGNLAPSLDEAALKRAFGKYGPLASVKIMWPRDEEQRLRGRMTGFVAFMTRRCAEEALAGLQGCVMHDAELRLGWSKAVPLPPVPCWPPPAGAELGLSAAPHGALLPQAVQATPAPHAAALLPRVEVRAPRSAARAHIIDTLASYVALDGAALEAAVLQREHDNPAFAFLTDAASEEHAYYRWRVYSLAQGDSLTAWREEEFQMLQGGALWKPPPQPDAAPQQHPPGGAVAERPLSDAERDAFEDALRALSVERASIRDAMLFALDRCDAAAEVSDTLVQALLLSETPAATKVARLFLLSDILHNSASPAAQAAPYRAHLVPRLPDVFEGLHAAYAALDSRIAAQALRRHVTAVLRAWADWFMFGADFLAGLEASFLRGTGGAARLQEDVALRAQLESMADGDLARRCRDSGVSALGGRAACVSRLLDVDRYRRAQRGEVAAREEEAWEAPSAQTERPAAQDRGGWAEVLDSRGQKRSRSSTPER